MFGLLYLVTVGAESAGEQYEGFEEEFGRARMWLDV